MLFYNCNYTYIMCNRPISSVTVLMKSSVRGRECGSMLIKWCGAWLVILIHLYTRYMMR